MSQGKVKSDSLEYRPAIDGLRALAVLSVFIFHLNHSWLPGGFVGVDVFFVISGYLITSIIFKECQNGSFSLKKFYQRRIARIFPAFFTVALVTLIGARFIYSSQDFASTGATLTAAALSVVNMKLMVQGNYFEMSPDAQPFLHYWSLSVEEQFYLFFHLLLLSMFTFARKRLVLLLGLLCALSFLACVVVTRFKPDWGFYLLPTRAWELFVGSLLAVCGGSTKLVPSARWSWWASVFSLVLIALSFVALREGNHFPGYWALLPVIGSAGVLAMNSGGLSEKWLALPPLVLIGRISYSLYLWHWPIFALVDYRLYFVSEPARLMLKVGLSFLFASLSFWLIENPMRVFLNRRQNMPWAYGALFCALIICVPLGIAVRMAFYLNAEPNTVLKGGLVFNAKNGSKSVILMGDSNGSMYGEVMKKICTDLNFKLSVISVAAGDPLPSTTNGACSQLWLDSLAAVNREKPDFLIISCHWSSKLKGDTQRLVYAIEALKKNARNLVILNQPPILPNNINRAAIRAGARPPFYEDKETRRRRLEANEFLKHFISENCSVIDVSIHFQKNTGDILFCDGQGRELYHDATHLSGFGADLILPVLMRTILYYLQSGAKSPYNQ
ncbi:MAG: acyltransferase family protein [Verrucomicrobiota bacterium]